jgi:ADP-ribose pyrophosphatase YjhB (NUDIX family)
MLRQGRHPSAGLSFCRQQHRHRGRADRNGLVQFLPADTYALVERSVPLVCVDFVPARGTGDGTEIGLILRDSPFGAVWCHLGGRIGRGETIGTALLRHARDSLAVDLEIDVDPQPAYVYQWFPAEIAPSPRSGLAVGHDPRKHAVGLSYVVEMTGTPAPSGEATDFAWFRPDALPDPLWPGCRHLLSRLMPTRIR